MTWFTNKRNSLYFIDKSTKFAEIAIYYHSRFSDYLEIFYKRTILGAELTELADDDDFQEYLKYLFEYRIRKEYK